MLEKMNNIINKYMMNHQFYVLKELGIRMHNKTKWLPYQPTMNAIYYCKYFAHIKKIKIASNIYAPFGIIEIKLPLQLVETARILPSRLWEHPKPPPIGMKVKIIFLDLYLDSYGAFNRVYYSIGGLYVTLGNLPFQLRQSADNLHIWGLVPPDSNISDCLNECMIEQIKKLQRGYECIMFGEKVWLVGGIGCWTCDLPQGNEIANVKSQSATFPCRMCLVDRPKLNCLHFDIETNARTYKTHLKQIQQLRESTENKTKKNSIAKSLGIQYTTNTIEQLAFDMIEQTPFDALHMEKGGLTKDCIENLYTYILTEQAQDLLDARIRSMELPHGWSQFQSIHHRKNWSFQDCHRFGLMAPFILHNWLQPKYIKKNGIKFLNDPKTLELIKQENKQKTLKNKKKQIPYNPKEEIQQDEKYQNIDENEQSEHENQNEEQELSNENNEVNKQYHSINHLYTTVTYVY
jgi:hypothetical protein